MTTARERGLEYVETARKIADCVSDPSDTLYRTLNRKEVRAIRALAATIMTEEGVAQ